MILLLPAPEHRKALLRDGPCGARVPTWRVFACDHHGMQPETAPPIDTFCPRCHAEGRTDAAGRRGPVALVLRLDGTPTPEGCDRAARVAGWGTLPATWTNKDVAELCGYIHGLGTVVTMESR